MIAVANRAGCSIPIMCATSGQTRALAFGVLDSRCRAVTATSETSRNLDMAPGHRRLGHPSRAIGSRSIVRTWRVRPASVRTRAAGMTPVAIFSITAASPA